ncbi:MAG: helix-turn-helix transcriptional regulator [Nitrospirota bacterium]
MSVGKNIKLFRINANLKQKELAKKLEIKDSYLSLIENEKKEPSLSLLKKISEVLNVPIGMFFWENMEKTETTTPIGRLKRLLFELDAEMKRPHAKSKAS